MTVTTSWSVFDILFDSAWHEPRISDKIVSAKVRRGGLRQARTADHLDWLLDSAD